MTADLMYIIAGVGIFAIGFNWLIIAPHILRKILAINVMGSGIFMLLIVTAQENAVSDPVPHAMVLTGIVVAIAGTTLALFIANRAVLSDKEDSQ